MTEHPLRILKRPRERRAVLLVGDSHRPEFDEARACLGRWAVVGEAADVDEAALLAAEEHSPDLIVVAQSRPGEFSHAAIDRLRRHAPVAPIVGLMGAWCEGEMRSGLPWPACARLYWHQWPARCERESRRLVNGRPSSWTLPVTATEEERLLLDASAMRQRTGQGGLVVIRSESSEMAAWLLEACRNRNLPAVWQRHGTDVRVEGATAAIFDAGGINDAECAELRRFCQAVRPSPVVALLGFPRIEEHRRVLAAGVASVLSKPIVIDDLFAQIDG